MCVCIKVHDVNHHKVICGYVIQTAYWVLYKLCGYINVCLLYCDHDALDYWIEPHNEAWVKTICRWFCDMVIRSGQGWGQLRSWSWSWVQLQLQLWSWSWNWSWNLWSWSWSWYLRDLPELELELELKLPELELELELIFKRLAGVGVGVGVENPGLGVGIGVETLGSWSWNWSWNFVKFFIYTYIQVLFETYNFETVPIILCLLTR